MGKDKSQMTFQDLMKKSKSPADNDDFEAGPSGAGDGRQDFYAGSGQNIVGNRGEDPLVSSIINQARITSERRNMPVEDLGTSEKIFVGKPRTLYGGPTEESKEEQIKKGDKPVIKVLLVFWSDGFSIVSPKKTIFYNSGTIPFTCFRGCKGTKNFKKCPSRNCPSEGTGFRSGNRRRFAD